MAAQKNPIGKLPLAILSGIFLLAFVAFWTWLLAHRAISLPSGSMKPTLHVGDYLWPSTLSYGLSRHSYPFAGGLGDRRLFAIPPQRGDIAIFLLPRDNQTIYIKRVIGLPGDKIQMKEGHLFINGTIVPRKRIVDVVDRDFSGFQSPIPAYEETLPEGGTYMIQEVSDDTSPYDNTGVYDVPEGHYFVLGDNRDNSVDSRMSNDNGVGMVPLENFIAKVDWVVFSTEEDDRFLHPVH